MMKFDLTKWEGVLAVFSLGFSLACYGGYIAGNAIGGVTGADLALVFAILGSIFLITGVVLLFVRAREPEGDAAITEPTTLIPLIALFLNLLFIIAGAIVGL